MTLGGALTGFLVGLTGVGGGSLMTPLLMLAFGVAPLTAVGTDLWFAATTKLVAAGLHRGHGTIDWPIVRRLWLGSLSASAATLAWMKLRPVDQSSVHLMTVSIAVALLITAFGILFQRRLHGLGSRLREVDQVRFRRLQPGLTVAAGVVLGVLVTLTSVGAGAIGTVALVYLYPRRLTPPRLIATDIVHAIPLALFAGAGHLMLGDVQLGLLGNLLLGSIPGVILGTRLSTRLPHQGLRALLALLLLALGAHLLLR
ncbi:MAG: sulfite exporter TauE/SafE family protein [Burkholderiales bacterium]|nr:sulfite exporter TauE/SafE family protein [Burkholderiales bacterium]MDE1925740.1 sulfite exporter TauE/SafE family protein [Burkholderiales bacterium]MDE2157988.1 sulfite exporter TauE/SafE family protein [Burkholderiales bacterium]MDE2502576.1 sulfite exporter TauE/SafE family protein [Burkholderiales bacterium]